MKERKGKQAETEVQGTEASDVTEAAVEAEPAATLHLDRDAAPTATEDESARAEMVVGEVGDDDVTNRIAISSVVAPLSDDAFAAETTTVDRASQDLQTDGAAVADGGDDVDVDADVTAAAAEAGDAAESGSEEPLPGVDGGRLESILESLLFATDRPLSLVEFKRLLGERDGKRITAALESLRQRRTDSGIQLGSVAGAWQLRTHPENGAWVAKLVAGRPPRLSRAMMETLSIVAYRQPITRPEIDEIRGVDCGPVLRTLLDRGLIRIIGKKEEVGRPMLYGTTPEFLKVFSLRDLTELPTLREFHELGADDRAKVDAQGFDGASAAGSGEPPVSDPSFTQGPFTQAGTQSGAPAAAPGGAAPGRPPAGELPDVDPDEEDALLDALDRATQAAGQATRSASEPEVAPEGEPAAASTSPEAGDR